MSSLSVSVDGFVSRSFLTLSLVITASSQTESCPYLERYNQGTLQPGGDCTLFENCTGFFCAAVRPCRDPVEVIATYQFIDDDTPTEHTFVRVFTANETVDNGDTGMYRGIVSRTTTHARFEVCS